MAGAGALEAWGDPPRGAFWPWSRPEPGPLSCLGRRGACNLPFPTSQGVGELDLPASRGCCAAATTLATAALRRRRRAREAAPCESLAGALAAAGGYRIYRGHCWTLGGGSLRALPYLPGAAQSFLGVVVPRLNYVFIQGRVVPRGALRARGWAAFTLRERGLAAAWVGCGSWVAAYVYSWVGVRRTVCHLSPGSLGPRSWQGCARGSGEAGWALSVNATLPQEGR